MTVAEVRSAVERLRPGGMTAAEVGDAVRRLDLLMAYMIEPHGYELVLPGSYADDTVLPVPEPYDRIYPLRCVLLIDTAEADLELTPVSRAEYDEALREWIRYVVSR